MVRSTLAILGIFMLMSGCRPKAKVNLTFRNPEVYVFLAHCYARDYVIDRRIPKITSANHHFWLGGDICLNTANDTGMLKYLDYFFDLKSPETHWTPGNHDLHDGFGKIEEFTGKPEYYAADVNGITLIVINSNRTDRLYSCQEAEAQTEFVISVLDTVQKSSHVILMSHHIFWSRMNKDSVPVSSYANTNHSHKLWKCDTEERAHDILLPRFNKLLDKGIGVILLAGDMGQKRSAYEHTNENGLVFLGNGGLSDMLYNNEKFPKAASDDSVLVFTHYPDRRTLSWKFVNAGN